MAISSMQQPRQMYGLGSFVKKFTRPLKKIAKSPLGKAALLGAGAYFAPTLFGGTAGFGKGSTIGNYFRSGAGKGIGSFFGRGVDKFNNLSFGKKALLGLGAGAVALPFLGGEEEEEEIMDPFSTTPSSITDIVSMAKARDPSLRFMPRRLSVQDNFYAADGGIAKLSMGGGAGQEQMMQALQAEYMKYKQQGGTMPFKQFAKAIMQQQQQGQTQMAADGGRIGYANAGPVMQENVEVINEDRQEVASNNENDRILESLFEKYLDMGMSMEEAESAARMEFDRMSQAPAMQEQETIVEDRVMANSGGMIDYMSSANPMARSYLMEDTDIVNMYRPGGDRQMAAEGGIMDKRGLVDGPGGYAGKKKKPNMVEMTSFEDNLPLYSTGFLTALAPFIPFLKDGGRVPAQEGGIMDLGGMEKDYRAEGGFVPIGGQEKADDVPARLSKNEFVFTADAVRNAGGGDIDEGAEVMERMMNNLEQGGQVSEESQGGNPAQEMFDTSQQLESRIA